MAGTDKTQQAKISPGGPVIVLVQPQLGQNIGAAARAMWNCGLADLRLVNPREGWPNDWAVKAASGADDVIEAVRVFARTEDAIADLHHIYAATARRRDMIQEVMTPRAAAHAMRVQAAAGGRIGVLFGPERAGLDNDDTVLAQRLIQAPLNPASSSLNLAQAVLLVAYEWFQEADATPDLQMVEGVTGPASAADLLGLFEHLEAELDDCGFLHVAEKRPSMVRNIRNVFQRAGLMEQEVKFLRGIVTCLSQRRKE